MITPAIGAFWDYMNHMINENPHSNIDREHTIAKLEAIVARLKHCMYVL